MADFIIDADPFIPTGVPATAEQVAAMVVDPDIPVTEATLPLLAEEQRPTPAQLADAEAAAEVAP